ncbi:MAG: glycosyltransferase family 1 protein [Rhizomicrobium sp.]|nr:glycosyltransferase family 1 protein [Rhizomicrobium sp.]
MTVEWSINGRFRGQTLSGVQRVAAAYLRHLKSPHTVLMPRRPISGVKAHLWEQIVLPQMTGGRPLWSPCNTGPLAVTRQVVTIHDAAVFDHPEWFSHGFVRLYNLLLPPLAKRCLRVVTVSEFSRIRLAQRLGIDVKRIDVIWNGVDKNFAPHSSAEIDVVKNAVGIGGARYFASLSTLEPRKNLSLVLRAWQLAQPFLPKDMKLLIIGKKGAASVFREDRCVDTNIENVVYTGYLSEKMLPALLGGAEAVLYPSLYEGFGLPVVEAMACGAPVMTTRLASLPEIAGDAAIYVDAEDPQSLADQLICMAKSADFRSEYSGRGIERVKLFSWPEAAKRMDAILTSLA